MSKTAKSLKDAGNNAFKAGKYEEAIALYTQCLQVDPSEYTVPLNRAFAHLKLGKYADAERDATKSLKLQPAGNTKALFRRAAARKALGKLDKAKEDLEAALVEEPANAPIKAELEDVLKLLDEQGTSSSTAKAASAEAPKSKPAAEKSPTTTARPETNDQQETPASSSRTSALKAAITPENADNDSLLKPLSTRRLGSTAPEPPHSSKAGQSSPNTEPVTNSFEALKLKRKERTVASLSLKKEPPPQASTSTGAPATTAQASRPLPPQGPAVPRPRTMYDFERQWSNDRSSKRRLALLRSLDDDKIPLPAYVGSNLSPELVDDILECLHSEVAEDPDVRQLAINLLDAFSRCARFDLVSMMAAKVHLIPAILGEESPETTGIMRKWGY